MERDLVDYFIDETNKKFDDVTRRFDHIDEKLDELFAFKWKIIGMASITSFCLTLSFELLLHVLKAS